MNNTRIAIATEDKQHLSDGTFGQSQFFQVYEINSSGFRVVETRENVLFEQSCDIRGRSEHLHGLLGDVQFFIGSAFEGPTQMALEQMGHHLIITGPNSVEKILEKFGKEIIQNRDIERIE